MKLEAAMTGSGQLSERFAELAELTGLEETLRQAADDVRAEAVRRLENGVPPDSDRGNLARSLDVQLDGETFSYRVGTTLDHGRDLELGTRARSALPWLGSALEAAMPAINDRLRRFLASATRAVARP